jgi:hypothetical protein
MENDTNLPVAPAAEAAPATPRRGRPPRVKNQFKEIAKEAAEPAEVAPEPVVESVIDRPDPRPEQRTAMREEDPRTRAARRAAEIRNHIGNMDEGPDDFYVNQSMIPPGWTYEWKRKTIMGQEDPAYQVQLARMGWEPVPASRHPSYMPEGSRSATIERKGMILMERPSELSEEARHIESRRAKNQVRQKEAQLNSAPEGQFGRDNKGNSMANIKKSYEAMPIPKD